MPQTPGPSTFQRWSTIALLTFGTWSGPAAADSLRYFGGASDNDFDRVKISIDNPEVPADVGSTTDFTVEFFIKTAAGNDQPQTGCSSNSWTSGNIIIDRDRYSAARDYGISLGGGRINFGVTGENGDGDTLCGTTDLRDGQWHHVVLQRRFPAGQFEILVDGAREAGPTDGPDGNISYPNNGTPANSCGPGGSGPGLQPCLNDPFLVIGAEKHDQAAGFSGWVDELRISRVLRYASATYTVPTAAFVLDANTAALYHFDEGTGNTIVDVNANMSPGVRRFGVGGGGQAGPAWSTDSPFNNPSPGTLQFSQAQYSVQENVGQASVTVTRTGGTSGAASVTLMTADGTATAGADYSTVTTTLNWANGVGGSQTVQIPIIDDAAPESAESFNVQLSGASGASLGAQSSATVSIAANDQAPAPGTLQWSAANFAVTEGTANVTLTVNRVAGSSGTVTVNYATNDGSANAGADYTAASASLSFADGETTRTITVAILDDSAMEGVETLTVSLSNAGGGATLGNPTLATVTINDNDQPPPPGNNDGGGGASGCWEILAGLVAWLARRRKLPGSRAAAALAA